MNEDRVRIHISDTGVATVTMVRSDKHNALDKKMFQALLDAANEVASNRNIRAVVLHGDGKSISAGAVVSTDERLSWPRTIGVGDRKSVV